MKVLYLIQTYKNPEQIYRLVKTLKKSSPESQILVSHNFAYCNLDVERLKDLPGVEVLNAKGGRGDFSLVQAYLDAIDWIFTQNIDFDWLFDITGQDYPTQPLDKIEKFLAETEYDGFIQYFEALSDETEWDLKESRSRYLYQYWRSNLTVPGKSLAGKILNRLRLLFNDIQPFAKMCWSFDTLMVGFRPNSTPFDEKFVCYGGSYFHILSQKCVRYLYIFSQQNPDLVDYYRKTLVPDESFIQTILINSKLFNLSKDNKRYIDFTNCEDGRPNILTTKDYPKLIEEGVFFARKFEPAEDSKILDMLDSRVLPEG